jgi:hypothetical protein
VRSIAEGPQHRQHKGGRWISVAATGGLVLLQTLKSGEQGMERPGDSGRDLKELGNEDGLCRHIAVVDAMNLSLPNHRHYLVAN